MSLVFIRQKARDLRAKTRRQLLGTLTVPLVVAFFYAFSAKQFPGLGYVLHALFAFAMAWSVAGLYIVNRGNRSAAMPEDAGFSTGLEFCRREIERQCDYFGRDLLWSFGPVLLAMGTLALTIAVVAGAAVFSKAMPLILLMAVWVGAYIIVRARRQRGLRRELEDLRDIERESSRYGAPGF